MISSALVWHMARCEGDTRCDSRISANSFSFQAKSCQLHATPSALAYLFERQVFIKADRAYASDTAFRQKRKKRWLHARQEWAADRRNGRNGSNATPNRKRTLVSDEKKKTKEQKMNGRKKMRWNSLLSHRIGTPQTALLNSTEINPTSFDCFSTQMGLMNSLFAQSTARMPSVLLVLEIKID